MTGPRAVAGVLLLLATGGCLNFGVVEDGALYRSGQPDAEDLRDLVDEHGLRSILNLKGEDSEDPAYVEEKAACAELDLVLHDVRLSARRLPRKAELLSLIEAFDRGPYPMLVHCHGGADRSALAAGIWLIVMRGASVERAREEFSLSYGHVGWLRGADVLEEVLDLYECTGKGKPFRRWLTQDYSYSK